MIRKDKVFEYLKENPDEWHTNASITKELGLIYVSSATRRLRREGRIECDKRQIPYRYQYSKK